jgi:hypothetical protein
MHLHETILCVFVCVSSRFKKTIFILSTVIQVAYVIIFEGNIEITNLLLLYMYDMLLLSEKVETIIPTEA